MLRTPGTISTCPKCSRPFNLSIGEHCFDNGELNRAGNKECSYRAMEGCKVVQLSARDRAALYAYHDQSKDKHWKDGVFLFGIDRRYGFQAADAVAIDWDHDLLFVKEVSR